MQLSVKLLAPKVAAAMSSVNTALRAALVATPVVGPGVVVAGTVSATRGRVVSASTPVVNCHTYGLSVSPVAKLAAPVTVAV